MTISKTRAARLAAVEGLGLVDAYLVACEGEPRAVSAGRLGVDLWRLNNYRRAERPVPPAKCAIMRRHVLGFLFDKKTAGALSRVLEAQRG